jgi:hypothetical protein
MSRSRRSLCWQHRGRSALLALAFPFTASPLAAQTITTMTGIPFHNSAAVWGTSANDLVVAGGIAGIATWNGSTWTGVPNVPGANRYSVFGTGTGTLYSGGQNGYQSGLLLRNVNNGGWQQAFTAPTELIGLWAGPDGVLVSGDGRFYYSSDGVTFVEAPTGLSTAFNTDRLIDIWGRSISDAYIAGTGGLYQWNGTTFSKVSNISVPMVSVHYSGASWWAVGAYGQVWRGGGSQWTLLDPGTTDALWSVWAFSDVDVWVGTFGGLLKHYNGTTWTSYNTGATGGLREMYAVDDRTLFIGTYSTPGSIVRVDIPRTAVPEPQSVILMGLGLSALAVVGLRRRRRISSGGTTTMASSA